MSIKQNLPDVFVVDGDDLRALGLPVSTLDGKFVVDIASQLGRAISLLQSGDYDLAVMSPLASAVMRGYVHVLHNALGFIPARISLVRSNTTAEVQEDIEDIQTGVEQVLAYTKRMTDLLMEGKLSREPIDINLLLHTVIHRLSLSDQVGLFWHLMPAPLEISADRIFLEEVLRNMVLNAREAMEQSALAEIHIGSRLADDNMVEVWISDTGCGILPEHVSRVFDRHYTTKPDRLGVRRGIGLWFCKKVIQELHDGRVAVRSEPGVGTTFIMLMPLGDG